ncbi:MAG: hypothetical protein WDW38_004118 [Sanguina aurantia]
MSTRYPTYSIAGQTVLITGASSGIGEACAWRFADLGCKLILLARRTERLEELRQQLQREYPSVLIHLVVMDVRSLPALEGLQASLPEPFSEVDILINNAGLALGTATVMTNSLEDAADMFQTNVMAVIALTKTFSQGMLARNRGHVVNMSSIAGHIAYPGGSMYCATKHALDAFTTCARHDLVGSEVRVTAISPGAVQTEFSVVRFKGDQAKADAVYAGFKPLNGADIADNVIFACTRPLHVQIGDILILATRQSGPTAVSRAIAPPPAPPSSAQ